jgi:tetratricopeptide (TPR) repeat protein
MRLTRRATPRTLPAAPLVALRTALLALPLLAVLIAFNGAAQTEVSDGVHIDAIDWAVADEHLQTGLGHLERGAPELAVSELEAALEITPSHAEAALALGDALVQMGRYAASRRYYERALATQPMLVKRGHLRAVAYAALGDYTTALSITESLLHYEPDDVEALYLDGRLRVRTGDFDHGMAQLERALELDPTHHRAATEIGLAHLRDRDPESALGALEQANRLRINERPAIHGTLRALALLGRHDEAELQRVRYESMRPAWEGIDRERDRLQRNPRDAQGYLRLGEHYLRLRHLEEATGVLETAIGLDGQLVPAMRTLGTVYSARGMLAEAEMILVQALEIAPDDAAVHRELATCYQLTESHELARRHQRRYLELKAQADSSAAGGAPRR